MNVCDPGNFWGNINRSEKGFKDLGLSFPCLGQNINTFPCIFLEDIILREERQLHGVGEGK